MVKGQGRPSSGSASSTCLPAVRVLEPTGLPSRRLVNCPYPGCVAADPRSRATFGVIRRVLRSTRHPARLRWPVTEEYRGPSWHCSAPNGACPLPADLTRRLGVNPMELKLRLD